MKNNIRFYWLDILKIIGCFLVIINHTGGYIIEYVNNNGFGYNLFYSICFAICKIGVPIFIMVSGYLLLNNQDDYKSVFKKIIRVLVPLLFISIVLYIKKYDLNIVGFIKNFLSMPSLICYWYLYMLIGLYLVTPFLQKMIKNFEMKDYRNFIIVCLLVPSILYAISSYMKISINSNFFAGMFSICIGYYVAGIYLSKLELNKKNRNIAILSFILPIILFTLSLFLPYILNGKLDYCLDSYIYITTVLPSLSFFYLIRYYFENKKFNNIISKVLVELSLVTFGIYLFHMLVNYKIYCSSTIQTVFEISPYIGIILLEVLTFVLCGIVTYILRKIPIIKKYL